MARKVKKQEATMEQRTIVVVTPTTYASRTINVPVKPKTKVSRDTSSNSTRGQ